MNSHEGCLGSADDCYGGLSEFSEIIKSASPGWIELHALIIRQNVTTSDCCWFSPWKHDPVNKLSVRINFFARNLWRYHFFPIAYNNMQYIHPHFSSEKKSLCQDPDYLKNTREQLSICELAIARSSENTILHSTRNLPTCHSIRFTVQCASNL